MLPRKEGELLELRYKERKTFQECGERFGFSRQRAQQVASKAIKKLRHPSRIVFMLQMEGHHPAIIGQDQFEEVQSAIAVRKRKNGTC